MMKHSPLNHNLYGKRFIFDICLVMLLMLTGCSSQQTPKTPVGSNNPVSDNSSAAKSASPRSIASKQTVVLATKSGYLQSGTMSPDLKSVAVLATDASTGKNGAVQLFDLQTGKLQRTLTLNENLPMRHVAFSPDGALIAASGGVGGSSGEVTIWDERTGAVKQSLKGHNHMVTFFVFSPDSKMLASSDLEAIKLWEIETGSLRKKFNHLSVLAFSADGKMLATGRSREIKIWDIETGEEKKVLKGHTGDVLCSAFSPDGTTLASGGTDKNLRLWSVDQGATLSERKGHTNNIYRVQFNPSEGVIMTVGLDAIKVWKAQGEGTVLLLSEHKDYVLNAKISTEGNAVGTVSRDGTVKLWDIGGIG